VPKAPTRISVIAFGFGLASLAVVGRAAQLQLFQGRAWRAKAAGQQTVLRNLPARRGTLYDRNGIALAVSQETFGIGVAPRDLDDPVRTAGLIARIVGRPREAVRARLEADRVWVEWPGPFTWDEVTSLRNLRGVFLQRRIERFNPRPELAPGLIGTVDQRGRGATGLERAFDSVLAGRAGSAVMLRDAHGREYPAPSRPAADPVDGGDVVLTLDAELQEIAERSLSAAVADAHASGGDVVILQPATGEILAIASVRRRVGAAAGVVGAPYEPGSTAKIFTAAALLRTGKATPHDSVFAEQGTWVRDDRTIHDTHPMGTLDLSGVIRFSSNIGIAKLGERLTPDEQYSALRDFGFGTPTGIELPGESPGVLRRPSQWTRLSADAHAMGYEFSVTPIQLAAAYAVFANGGVLLEPTLVRETRDADGRLRWRHGIRPVRRVVSPDIADQLSHMLRGVVEEGTGQRAALGTYPLAGKTGTVRRNVGGRYEAGRYTASFVGLFPAVNPQLILLVKIDDPEGDYFGGSTAAPATRTILEAALATPAVTLDRTRLYRRQAPAGATREAGPRADAVTLPWPLAAPDTAGGAPRAVPDVSGQSLRAAARALHHAGFQVRIAGWGRVTGTVPAAGASLSPGATVTVKAEASGAL